MITRREFGAGSAAFGAVALAGCATVNPRAAGGFSIDDLERRTFRWFWDTANPVNGLVPDRWPS